MRCFITFLTNGYVQSTDYPLLPTKLLIMSCFIKTLHCRKIRDHITQSIRDIVFFIEKIIRKKYKRKWWSTITHHTNDLIFLANLLGTAQQLMRIITICFFLQIAMYDPTFQLPIHHPPSSPTAKSFITRCFVTICFYSGEHWPFYLIMVASATESEQCENSYVRAPIGPTRHPTTRLHNRYCIPTGTSLFV